MVQPHQKKKQKLSKTKKKPKLTIKKFQIRSLHSDHPIVQNIQTNTDTHTVNQQPIGDDVVMEHIEHVNEDTNEEIRTADLTVTSPSYNVGAALILLTML